MRVTIHICDICKDDINNDQKVEKCILCNKECCAGCSTEFYGLGKSNKPKIFCVSCFSEDKMDRAKEKYSRLPEVKFKIEELEEGFVQYLMKKKFINKL